eukprot:197064-Hanusia_phi.AAC.1
MALAGVAVSVTGGFERERMGEAIRRAGGRLDALVHKNLHALVADDGAVQRNTQRVRKALKLGVPIVRETFLLESLRTRKRARVEDHLIDICKPAGPAREEEKPEARRGRESGKMEQRKPGGDHCGVEHRQQRERKGSVERLAHDQQEQAQPGHGNELCLEADLATIIAVIARGEGLSSRQLGGDWLMGILQSHDAEVKGFTYSVAAVGSLSMYFYDEFPLGSRLTSSFI